MDTESCWILGDAFLRCPEMNQIHVETWQNSGKAQAVLVVVLRCTGTTGKMPYQAATWSASFFSPRNSLLKIKNKRAKQVGIPSPPKKIGTTMIISAMIIVIVASIGPVWTPFVIKDPFFFWMASYVRLTGQERIAFPNFGPSTIVEGHFLVEWSFLCIEESCPMNWTCQARKHGGVAGGSAHGCSRSGMGQETNGWFGRVETPDR